VYDEGTWFVKSYVRRYDHFRIDAFTRTPGGGLKVDGNLTRTGVFSYTNADGTTRREYRPDASVFDKAALQGLSEAPVTVGHPANGVNPENWKRLAVGHTGEARRNDIFVTAPVVVQDADAITRVENKELTELSVGYDIDYDPTPGVTPEGERYDGIQKNIRGNHIALLPPGKARAGSECSLRLDSNEDQEESEELSKISSHMTPEQILALQALQVKETARADKAEADLKGSSTRADQAEGKVAVLTAQLQTASDPKRFDSSVAERVELLDQARQDGVTVPANATPRAVRLAILAKRNPNFRADSLNDDSVAAAFAFSMALPHPSLAQPVVRADDASDPIAKARDEYLTKVTNLSEKK
jgi:uncharacterized protein